MHLIADSGSTKTHWCVVDKSILVKEVFTSGINPFYQSESEIANEISNCLLPSVVEYPITGITFYGAGCSFPEKKTMVSNALGFHFKGRPIEVQSDLLGAARGLFGRKQGIACILGTGSNSCFYDGETIVQNVSPLGFILGDEGSGAVLGKQLVADYLKKQLPSRLELQFAEKYQLDGQQILESVYKKAFPNRYLAKFTPFLSANIHEPYVLQLVQSAFHGFFSRNIAQYPTPNEIGFVGSIAFYFNDLLMQVANEKNFTVALIVQSPMEGLISYHSTI